MTLLQLKTHGTMNTESDDKPELHNHLSQSQNTTALVLCRPVPVIGMNETCREVMDKFKTNREIPCMVYCSESGKPQGLIMRGDMYRRMTGRFSREIYDHRSAICIADMQPMVVDISQPLSQLLHQALQRPESQFYDCVLITDQDKFIGALTVKDLLHLSTVLQEEAENKREFILNENHRQTIEIEESLSQVAEAAEVTQTRSQVMKEWSQSGKEKLEQVSNSYIGLVNGMEERAGFVSQLLQNADSISSITKQITEIANHSSLLAINASIEAAHAGEHGKGFQVVAGEVQTLAKQTRNLSEDISSLLIQIQHLVAETAEVTAASLEEIRSCESIVADGGRIFIQMGQVVDEVRDAGSQVYHLSEEAAERVKRVRKELDEMNVSHSYDLQIESENLENG